MEEEGEGSYSVIAINPTLGGIRIQTPDRAVPPARRDGAFAASCGKPQAASLGRCGEEGRQCAWRHRATMTGLRLDLHPQMRRRLQARRSVHDPLFKWSHDILHTGNNI